MLVGSFVHLILHCVLKPLPLCCIIILLQEYPGSKHTVELLQWTLELNLDVRNDSQFKGCDCLIAGDHSEYDNEIYEYEPMYEGAEYVPAEHKVVGGADSFAKVMDDHRDDMEYAIESVYFGLDGFGANVGAFMEALAPIAEHFNQKYVTGWVLCLL